jgi:hypothetical protein
MLSALFTTLITTIVAVLIGIGGWYWGHKTAMKQVDKHFKRQLEIEASTEVINSLSEVSRKFVKISVFLISISTQLKLYDSSHHPTRNQAVRSLVKAYDEFNTLQREASYTLLDFMSQYMKNAVVLNKVKHLCFGIRDEFYKSYIVYKPYEDCLMSFWHQDNTPIPISFTEHKLDEVREQLVEHGKEVEKFVMALLKQSNNVLIEIQNCYLSDLFDYQIPQPQLQTESKSSTNNSPSPTKQNRNTDTNKPVHD